MHDLSHQDARDILASSDFGTLSLAKGGDSYAVPMYFALAGDDLYFHCHPGLKDEYLAATKTACFTVVHKATADLWETVHAFGPVEKLTLSDDLEAAKGALFQRPFPPARGHYPGGTPVRTDRSVYYARLKVQRITGRGSDHGIPWTKIGINPAAR